MNSWALIFGSELALVLALLRFLTLFVDADADDGLDAFLPPAFSLLLLLLSMSDAVLPFFLTPADAKSEIFSPSTPSGAAGAG